MSWVKLDDNFTEHPKVAALPNDAAKWFHVRAMCYAARYQTGGEITQAAFKALAGKVAVADALVAAGLWETGRRGGWVIHDFEVYNPPASGRRGAAPDPDLSEKRRSAANARWHRDANGDAKPNANGDANLHVQIAPSHAGVAAREYPSRPVPSASYEADEGGGEIIDIGFRDRYGTLVTAFGGRVDERVADEFRQIATDYKLAQINEAIALARRAKSGQLFPSRIARFLPDIAPPAPVRRAETEPKLRSASEMMGLRPLTAADLEGDE